MIEPRHGHEQASALGRGELGGGWIVMRACAVAPNYLPAFHQ